MTAAARRQVFQTKEPSNPVLQMNDKVAFFQFSKVNVEGGAGGQRVRGFQPAWPLDSVAPENFRVGDDDELCFFTKKSPGEQHHWYQTILAHVVVAAGVLRHGGSITC